MQCPFCRGIVPDGSVQCGFCGSTFQRPGAAPEPTQAVQPPAPGQTPAVQMPRAAAPPPSFAPRTQGAQRTLSYSTRTRAMPASSPNRAFAAVMIPLAVIGLGLAGWLVYRFTWGRPPEPLCSQLRLYRSGDTWTYKVQSTIGFADIKTRGEYGDMTVAIQQSVVDGKPCMAKTSTMHLKSPRGQDLGGTEIVYFVQDAATRAVTVVGETHIPESGGRLLAAYQLDPGRRSRGAEWVTRAAYEGGVQIDTTHEVATSRVIETPAGKFDVWRVNESQTSRGAGPIAALFGPTTDSKVVWFAPQLGAEVKSSEETELPMLGQITVTAVLTSTNVKPDPKDLPEGAAGR